MDAWLVLDLLVWVLEGPAVWDSGIEFRVLMFFVWLWFLHAYAILWLKYLVSFFLWKCQSVRLSRTELRSRLFLLSCLSFSG